MIEKNRRCFINFDCFDCFTDFENLKNDFNFRIIENDLFKNYSRKICFDFDFDHCITHHKKVVAVI